MPVAECKIPVLDWGFLRGDATYDVVHTWNGRFFRLAEHLDRFTRNLGAPALRHPVRPRRHRRRAAPLRRADGPAGRVRRDAGHPRHPEEPRPAHLGEPVRRVRGAVRVDPAAGAARRRAERDRLVDRADPRPGGRPDREELPLARPRARAVRGLRAGRRDGGADRRPRQRARRPRLQPVRRRATAPSTRRRPACWRASRAAPAIELLRAPRRAGRAARRPLRRAARRRRGVRDVHRRRRHADRHASTAAALGHGPISHRLLDDYWAAHDDPAWATPVRRSVAERTPS